jgi:hypothetical protein
VRALTLAFAASCASISICACASPREPASGAADASAASNAAKRDPSKDEVRLEAAAGWRGTLVVDQGPIGVWTVNALKVFPQYACPEIVGLDDAGRLSALWSYSGKWTPVSTVHDGKWLGGLVQADLDPRVAGTELYTGSQSGNLYQVTVHAPAYLDSRVIAQLPGREIHTLVGGQLDLSTPAPELVVFTNPGGLFVLRARSDGRDGFEIAHQSELLGRIRDALLLPVEAGQPPQIATVGRHGKLEILSFADGAPRWSTIHEAPMGTGRLALKPGSTPQSAVLYTVADDGRVWRHERRAQAWTSELIYAGPQGMRGLAAGRFDADPNAETIAVFGYSKEVELLTRRNGVWSAETIFVDRDKGHWLCAAEVDGRNSTDELVAAGYSGRVVLLSRPPGYGLAGVLARDE